MTPCPICQQPVDALRARHVGVRDGKVVAFCSAECQARGAALATSAAVIAAAAAASAAEPVLPSKRSRTPAAGVKATRTPAAGVKVVEPPATDAAPSASSAPDRRITPAALAAAAAPGEVRADDPSASTIRRRRRRKDSLDAHSAWEWLDDEPAEEVGADRGEAEGRGRGRRVLVVLLVLAALGGGGYLAYRYGYLPGGGDGDGPAPADAAVTDAPVDAAPTPEQRRQAALDRATAVLRDQAGPVPAAAEAGKPAPPPAPEGRAGPELLARRMAAAALSRTGDPGAIAILAGLLEQEPSEAARLEISYQLARAGDPRGAERLIATLAGRSIDSRHDAARWLARLGDQRAVPVLTAAMAYSQFRLPAAEVLAYVADPGAIKFLEETRANAAASAEERARATIALGRARRATADELRALLTDKRNAEAAPVLAELGDPTARPLLHEQLAFEHSCVEAARALRRFGDETDRAEGLRTLLAALGGDGATARIRAAEAILLLAGPARWSERM